MNQKSRLLSGKKLFDSYLLATRENEFSADRKRALLIHCLGTEGQRSYSTLLFTVNTYDESVLALITYFSLKLNVVAKRYHFRQRAQVAGVSTDHYVAALRELVKHCKFGNMESEMPRDHITEKTNNRCICGKTVNGEGSDS